MKQLFTIFKFELKGYLKNKIFVGITIFLMCAVIITLFIPNIISIFSPDDGGEVPPADKKTMVIYCTDQTIEPIITSSFSASFTDYNVKSETAKLDEIKGKITSGEIDCAFVINSLTNYTYIVNNLSMYDTNSAVAGAVMQEVYRTYLMSQSGLSQEQIEQIMNVQITSSVENLGKNQAQNFFYTYIMIFALYMVILLYGQMVATNVATEKSSRAMEVLVTSAKPTSMMFGKVLASCLAGLMQLVAVFGTALIFYNINKGAWGDNQLIKSLFDIPMDIFIYLLVFFLLGYLIYAFLYGAIGSTASKLEDINTSVMPITFLFLIAFFVVIFAMSSGNVDTVIMKVCSYIPFTSPMAMFTRIAMSTVPWYEILISITVLIASTIGVGFLSARIYRAGVLMYGKQPKFNEILKMMFKK